MLKITAYPSPIRGAEEAFLDINLEAVDIIVLTISKQDTWTTQQTSAFYLGLVILSSNQLARLFYRRQRLFFPSPLYRRRYMHGFAIFCDSSPRNVDTIALQGSNNLVI